MEEIQNSDSTQQTRVGARQGDRAKERQRSASHGSPFERLGQFLRDVRAELKRVSWPSGREVQNTTIITLIAVIFFALYLFAVDQAWARLITGLDWLLSKLVG